MDTWVVTHYVAATNKGLSLALYPLPLDHLPGSDFLHQSIKILHCPLPFLISAQGFLAPLGVEIPSVTFFFKAGRSYRTYKCTQHSTFALPCPPCLTPTVILSMAVQGFDGWFFILYRGSSFSSARRCIVCFMKIQRRTICIKPLPL